MTKFNYLVVTIFFFSFTKIYAIEDISINNDIISPHFNQNTYNYNYFTNENTAKITVIKSKDEIVSGNNTYELKEGENTFYIDSVINDVTKQYTINVYKNYTKEDDNIITFKSLSVENTDIIFSNDIYDYYIDNYDGSSLIINYELNNLSNIVEISNNGNFTNGNNKVLIKIKSKDEKLSKTYTIHVNKTVEVFKEIDKPKQMSFVQKEIILFIIIIISSSIVVFLFNIIFIKKLI